MNFNRLAATIKQHLSINSQNHRLPETFSLKRITDIRTKQIKTEYSISKGAESHYGELVRFRLRKLLVNCSWIAEHLISKTMPCNGDIDTERRRARLLSALDEFKLAANDIKRSDISKVSDIDIDTLDCTLNSLIKNIYAWTSIIKHCVREMRPR